MSPAGASVKVKDCSVEVEFFSATEDGESVLSYPMLMVSPVAASDSVNGGPSAVSVMVILLLLKSVIELSRSALSYP